MDYETKESFEITSVIKKRIYNETTVVDIMKKDNLLHIIVWRQFFINFYNKMIEMCFLM